MSIQASLKPEAMDTLQKQKRFSTIASVVVSVLVVTLIALVLGIFLIPNELSLTNLAIPYSSASLGKSPPKLPVTSLPAFA